MPAQYEAIKSYYMKKGKSKKEAEKLAAMTYNAHHKDSVADYDKHHKQMMKYHKETHKVKR